MTSITTVNVVSIAVYSAIIVAIALFNIVICTLLSSCSYKQNEWISEEKLTKCLIPDFPEIKDNYVVKGNSDIYVNFSKEEYEGYVGQVYEYLKSKNFLYLGTRGELKSSLSGAFNTYSLKFAESLEDFYVDGAYRFVYSDGKTEELDDTFRFSILTINTIGLNDTKTIEDDGIVFKYNTVISIDYNSEYPLSGRYVLPDNMPIIYDDIAELSGIEAEEHENYTIFRFNGFDGKATLKMERKDLERDVIYYTGKLANGAMYVNYDLGPYDSTESLYVFYEGVTIPDENSTVGKVDQDELAIIFETMSPVTGEIIISFIPFDNIE